MTRFIDLGMITPRLLHQDVRKQVEILVIGRGLALGTEVDGSVFGANPPSPGDDSQYIAHLLELLDAEDNDTVRRACDSLREYYCHPSGMFAGKETARAVREDANSWQAQFKGMTRKQILFARLQEEPDLYALDFVPAVLPRDEAMDCLIDWAIAGKHDRSYALYVLRLLSGLDLAGCEPNEVQMSAACSYWRQVKALGHDDRTRLCAIGRLLTRRYEGFPICWRLSESEARRAFRRDEGRSLALWRQLYDLALPRDNPSEQDEASRIEAVAVRQMDFLGVLARVNSPTCIALVRKIGKEHQSEWLRGNVWEMLHGLTVCPESVMEEPVAWP